MASVMHDEPRDRWADGDAPAFPVDRFDQFLLWADSIGASDVVLQTGRAACVEVDGVLGAVTRVRLDTPNLERLVTKVYGATGGGVLRDGRDLDCSYEVVDRTMGRRRFRVNVSAVQVRGAFGINMTLRVLPGSPLPLEALGISLIPYGNEPEGLGVSQPVGDVGIGLSGAQMLS